MSKLIKPVPSLEEQRREQEKLHDILLMLDHLFKREEATAKMILDHLYDIGTVNIINNKVPLKLLSPFLKLIATSSKPLISIIAVRLFQAKCPKLITDYLYSLVEFKPLEAVEILVEEPKNLSLPEVQAQLKEVKSLRKQVKMLTGSLVAIIAIFAGSSAFIAHKFNISPNELLQPTQAVIDQVPDHPLK